VNKRLKIMRNNLLESLDEKLEKSLDLFFEGMDELKKENSLQIREICSKLLEIM